MAQERLLITRNDIEEFFPIGKNLDDSRLLQHILRAQQSKLKPFLGAELYFDLIENFTNANNQALFNSGSYLHQNRTIFYGGIRQLLAAWSYSILYTANTDFVSRGGNVRKETEESENQVQRVTNTRTNEAESEAIRLQREVFEFIDQNRSDYPLYGVQSQADAPTRTSFRITKVQSRSTIQSRGIGEEGISDESANEIRYGRR